MIDTLPYADKEHPDPRAEFLDDPLGVEEWQRPGQVQVGEVIPGAPSWWHGDEEASQSMLRQMGINRRLSG